MRSNSEAVDQRCLLLMYRHLMDICVFSLRDRPFNLREGAMEFFVSANLIAKNVLFLTLENKIQYELNQAG